MTWWRHAVCYEVYPRSFADSNGDGIGDLPGVTERLGHLRDLGADAVWITPCYPSPWPTAATTSPTTRVSPRTSARSTTSARSPGTPTDSA